VKKAIHLADWFAEEQLRILSGGRQATIRAKENKVLELLSHVPKGITVRDVQRGRVVPSADDARELLARMEAAGELTGIDSQPGTGGHVTRIFNLPGGRNSALAL
jgi:hypothetical protein